MSECRRVASVNILEPSILLRKHHQACPLKNKPGRGRTAVDKEQDEVGGTLRDEREQHRIAASRSNGMPFAQPQSPSRTRPANT